MVDMVNRSGGWVDDEGQAKWHSSGYHFLVKLSCAIENELLFWRGTKPSVCSELLAMFGFCDDIFYGVIFLPTEEWSAYSGRRAIESVSTTIVREI